MKKSIMYSYVYNMQKICMIAFYMCLCRKCTTYYVCAHIEYAQRFVRGVFHMYLYQYIWKTLVQIRICTKLNACPVCTKDSKKKEN